MSQLISLTPEQMEGRATEYHNEAENVRNVISKMDTLLSNLQSEWQGSASQAYAEKYNELKPSFVKMQELIDEISESLKKTAAAYRETDANLASAWS